MKTHRFPYHRKYVILSKLIAGISAVSLLSSCVFVIDKRDEDPAAKATFAETSQSSAAEAAAGSYSFACRDENSAPIEGVLLKVCSDNLCTLIMTDSSGAAYYPASDGKCEVCVMSYPDGYVLADDECIAAADASVEYCFTFAAAGETGAAETASEPAVSDGLTATLSGSSVLLKWKPAESADAYRVYKCDEDGGNCHSLVRTLDTDYEAKDTEPGIYLFRVAALKKDGGYYTESGVVGEVKVAVGGTSSSAATAEVTAGAAASEFSAEHENPSWSTFDFEICDADGKCRKLSSLAGKPVIINVWATWCGYCVDELPSFEKLYKKYGDEVQFVMLNCDGRGYESEVTSYVSGNGWTFPVYFDRDDSTTAYFGGGVPVTAAISAQGNLELVYEGAAQYSQLETAVKSVIGMRRSSDGEKRIKVGETESRTRS